MPSYTQIICAAHVDLTDRWFECDLRVNQLHSQALLDSAGKVEPIIEMRNVHCADIVT